MHQRKAIGNNLSKLFVRFSQSNGEKVAIES
jgi:hypothetical protein